MPGQRASLSSSAPPSLRRSDGEMLSTPPLPNSPASSNNEERSAAGVGSNNQMASEIDIEGGYEYLTEWSGALGPAPQGLDLQDQVIVLSVPDTPGPLDELIEVLDSIALTIPSPPPARPSFPLYDPVQPVLSLRAIRVEEPEVMRYNLITRPMAVYIYREYQSGLIANHISQIVAHEYGIIVLPSDIHRALYDRVGQSFLIN
ncbi:hypothetical protein AJ80_04809 [Polytolypa hystricis UAMH7299]|uniref:Uncharacterized protein n=1 Tax=Polytolypa hystricis (strain UAMH7299) TaxID=1447883 RepID=A0A2B7Y8L7_POLH7|nr:hypothetical protein AJ80_04809 [Polytolypa hystricis UAMH7299]